MCFSLLCCESFTSISASSITWGMRMTTMRREREEIDETFFLSYFLLIFIELYTHYYSYAYMDPDKTFSFSFINIYQLEYLQHPFVFRVCSRLVWKRIDTTRTWGVRRTLSYGWAAKVWSVWVDGCLSEKIPDVTQDFPF